MLPVLCLSMIVLPVPAFRVMLVEVLLKVSQPLVFVDVIVLINTPFERPFTWELSQLP